MSRNAILLSLTTFAACFGIFNTVLFGQAISRTHTLIAQAVDEGKLVTLHGNTHPAVYRANDLGPVSDAHPLQHMFLQLKRSAEQQAELNQYINDLHSPKSANYHKWLTAAQFGQRFGASQQDVTLVTEWLQSHGFTVNFVYPNQVIDFSGTAGQIRSAFHTEIHNLNVDGEHHMANVRDPQIPAALAAAVQGPVALHDFKPRRMSRPRSQYTASTEFGTLQLVVPGDLQTIYNINLLYQAGISGQGQTIAVLGESDLYSTGDWNLFRKAFGLARKYPHGNLVTVHPQPGMAGNCGDPGVNANDVEAAVDTEWASAAAPNATIMLASCADTEFNFGILIAMENLLTGSATPPSVISMSFGAPETDLGSDFNAYINSLYEFAVVQGVSVFVSTGDAGAAAADQSHSVARSGITTNGLATTPNNVAVGGTDFADSFFGINSQYWSDMNGLSYNSAVSYIPEIPWNSSCASQLIAFTVTGSAVTYGPTGFCNNTFAIQNGLLNTDAGSGGPSNCASGSPLNPPVVGGDCAGYSKPLYQTILGNPNDGVRDIPDVSLFAANGIWSHYYVICYSDPSPDFGGAPCSGQPINWAGAGGTSFSSPIMAGIQALVNQATNSLQGNPNYVYYALAASEYGASGSAGCGSTNSLFPDPSCIFYDVTLGDIDVNCRGSNNCYQPGGTNGVLSTSDTSYQPAFGAAVGWDFATGIGSVNAYNLVAAWPGSSIGASSTAKVLKP